MSDEIRNQLAPTGVLRAGINMANQLLVTGAAPSGEPDGVGPEFARHIADGLGVSVAYVQFATPGELADAVTADVWDIGLIGAEPARAEKIAFTAAYVEIEATYLVAEGSPFMTIQEVDSEGVRIAVSGRSAYDLYLSRSLKHAELHRAQGLPGALELFLVEKMEALAGLRPALTSDLDKVPGGRILDGQFTSVQQAVGTARTKTEAAAYLSDVVEDAKASGLIARLIEKHGVVGRLSVAGAA
jgi:polar amino acid transport system substrate-binding protein